MNNEDNTELAVVAQMAAVMAGNQALDADKAKLIAENAWLLLDAVHQTRPDRPKGASVGFAPPV